ncbi:homocysteine S-methyltransferase family protein [Yoonia sp. 208BN28-4]|uniref:homocysteine S-methyltransferase family protein n=1 Tax=Yoonia sp. 208BN28-4 TaxID=3126505 RepID=UPI0030A62E6C
MADITLLDGGMGQELVHRAGDRPTALWSTQVMIDRPGLVAEIHRDYFDAGATVATTNTYAIHRDRLTFAGIENQFDALHAAALKEAATAQRDGTRIAGAIGPLVASYRPDVHPAADQAIPLYTEVANILAPQVDLLICETVVSVDHARSILAAATQTGKPVWLAVSVDDRDGAKLRSGEPLADVIPVAKEGGAAALLINCSSPEAVSQGLPVIADCGLPFGGYANGFTQITSDFLEENPTVDALTQRRDMGPDAYAGHVMAWIGLGATIVGGCCEVGPAHIRAMADAIREAGHRIV